ncbi:MAG: SEC-C domain-containing protein [Proteobacteria bacterium]|nr:SEC-C domain-containing protein [Pseudomonadota bacterium]
MASLTKNDPLHDHLEHEEEEHQHHAGCLHSKQIFPAIQKVKIGRNDPCSCGSGKKYKKCCLK